MTRMKAKIRAYLIYRVLAIVALSTIDSLLDHRVVLVALSGSERVLIGFAR